MSELYQPLSRQDQKTVAASFLKFLKQRDGTPEPTARRLSKREKYFQQLEKQPLRSSRYQIDPDTFKRNHEGRQLDPNLNEVMLWMLSTAKLNRGERYGVDIQLAYRLHKNKIDLNDPQTFIEIEEFYHTRILLDVLRTFNLEVEILPPASRISRFVIQAMVYLPPNFSIPMVMAGEVFGVAAFYSLREKAKELFAGEPEVLQRVLSLYDEIMVDEIGHVVYAQARLNRVGLWFAKKMQSSITKSLLKDLPELAQLIGHDKLQERIDNLERILNGNEDWPVQPFRLEASTLATPSFA